MRVVRALLLSEPPSIDAGEITGKGYVNQRTVRLRRAGEAARLHPTSPGELAGDVIAIDSAPPNQGGAT